LAPILAPTRLDAKRGGAVDGRDALRRDLRGLAGYDIAMMGTVIAELPARTG